MAIPIDLRAREAQERHASLRRELYVALQALQKVSVKYHALRRRHDKVAACFILSLVANLILAYVLYVKGNQ